ncbi:MAG TPA: glycosyltransferase family 4 protein [Steroidobacteraceae bacterium]|nr:glycosyltransferase family 4 protein [Steroidobacteraceae bacterium]
MLSILAVAAAGLVSATLTWAIRPLLVQYAVAKPNARSSHRVPTPQGAGIAVVAATLLVVSLVAPFAEPPHAAIPVTVLLAAVFIAVVGFADDVKSIAVLPRLMLQAVAIAAVVLSAPGDLRIVPACPLWIERSLLLIAGLWFVNLVNFMDGLDWMTVAEVVPVAGAIIVLGSFHGLPQSPIIVAAALCGAMLGFAPFNRPVAQVFLGDVGSLPIGLLLGWCLLQTAYSHLLVASLLLPLYYLADASVTLSRRLLRGEKVWTAHRSHFYQRATDNGFAVIGVVREVFALNVGLAVLAIASTTMSSTASRLSLLLVGVVATASLMFRFSRQRLS